MKPTLAGKLIWSTAAVICLCLQIVRPLEAQDRQVGLMRNQVGRADGYVLFQPIFGSGIYLIDNEGMLVHSWTSEFRQAVIPYLLEDGSLLRAASAGENSIFNAGGASGRVNRRDWDGNLLWHFELNTDTARLHHDIEPMPNGNILMISWEFRSTKEAYEAGRDTIGLGDTGMWPLWIIEVEPADSVGGEIVWEWRLWDHMVQGRFPDKANFGEVVENPGLVDINYSRFGGDFVHTNAIDYNAELDQIAVSSPTFNEIWIIDHSTTVEEAASHSGGNGGVGGDLLYRWGNPQTYRMGDDSDQQLFFQHDVEWIPSGYPGGGNLTIFNNGRLRPDGDFSEVFEIDTPEDGAGGYLREAGKPFGPDEPVWNYTSMPREDFYSPIISGAHRVWTGTTFVTSGVQGTLFEVTPSGSVVWEYVNPVAVSGPIPVNMSPDSLDNRMFRATRYPLDYGAFKGRDLTPMGPLELAPVATETEVPDEASGLALIGSYPNPASGLTTITFRLASPSRVTISVFDELGRLVETVSENEWRPAGPVAVGFDAARVAPGVYFYSIETEQGAASGRLLVTR